MAGESSVDIWAKSYFPSKTGLFVSCHSVKLKGRSQVHMATS